MLFSILLITYKILIAWPLDGLLKPLSQISQFISHWFLLSIFEQTVKKDLFCRKVIMGKSWCWKGRPINASINAFYFWSDSFNLIFISIKGCVQSILQKKKVKNMKWKRPMNCASVSCFLLIMWPSCRFGSVFLPHGMQDENGWPTRSPNVCEQEGTHMED